MQVICDHCQKVVPFDPKIFRCSCGGAWEPLENVHFDQSLIDAQEFSVWRYRKLMGLEEVTHPLSLGAGWTPLVTVDWQTAPISFKLEYMAPSGSFKDRGIEVEANYLKAAGVRDVVEDSSGNAGASLAAYAARTACAQPFTRRRALHRLNWRKSTFTVRCCVSFRGHAALPPRRHCRLWQMGRAVYASHAYSPVYLQGQQTFAWEIWEQMGKTRRTRWSFRSGRAGCLWAPGWVSDVYCRRG
jgi:threonine synthase